MLKTVELEDALVNLFVESEELSELSEESFSSFTTMLNPSMHTARIRKNCPVAPTAGICCSPFLQSVLHR